MWVAARGLRRAINLHARSLWGDQLPGVVFFNSDEPRPGRDRDTGTPSHAPRKRRRDQPQSGAEARGVKPQDRDTPEGKKVAVPQITENGSATNRRRVLGRHLAVVLRIKEASFLSQARPSTADYGQLGPRTSATASPAPLSQLELPCFQS